MDWNGEKIIFESGRERGRTEVKAKEYWRKCVARKTKQKLRKKDMKKYGKKKEKDRLIDTKVKWSKVWSKKKFF